MKRSSEAAALEKLGRFKEEFRAVISSGYEHNAKPCSECDTPGACCLDAHFVNVRISRLEAVAIVGALGRLPSGLRARIFVKTDEAIRNFRLEEGSDDGAARTYACPLFDAAVGCTVHDSAKPLPCIHHACYENENEMPPDELLDAAEAAVEQLNKKVYGSSATFLPLPVAVRNAS
jgi:hypothetical protein